MSLHPDACSVLLDPVSAPMMASSASASAFLADEEASTCPLLLSATPSPPPLDYVDPPSRIQAEEEASTCPLLLSATPSPPPLDYVDPPTGAAGNPCPEQAVEQGCCIEAPEDEEGEGIGNEETSSSDGTEPAETLFGGMREYQHLGFGHQGVQDICSGKAPLPDTTSEPCFASWNWPVIRTCSFWLCTLAVAACGAAVAYTLATMPVKCNPETTWYRGGVFYEAPPFVLADSNGDGIGDLRGITDRTDYLKGLGISALRLNSIFPSLHNGKVFVPVTTLMDLDEALGTPEDFMYLANRLHDNNISLVLDFPIYPYLSKLEPVRRAVKDDTLMYSETDHVSNASGTNNQSNETDQQRSDEIVNNKNLDSDEITRALKLWMSRGVDGFYLMGLENLSDDENLLDSLASWKEIVGEDRILIVKRELLDNLEDDGEIDNVLASTDLVDVRLAAWNDSSDLGSQIERALSGPLSPERGVWIHWSLGHENSIPSNDDSIHNSFTSNVHPSNVTLAATLMQMMLPGTTSIYYGDEIALQDDESVDGPLVHLVDLHSTGQIAAMIRLRLTTPVIYRNAISKQDVVTSNFAVRHRADDLLVLERWYPRRNSFASITNMSPASVTLDMSGMFYSGMRMLYQSETNPDSQSSEDYEKIFFKSLHLHPHETLVVKLDK